ncbi:MAG: hypothetical protein LBG18_03510 [Mediterranea sp.]|jgi:hypothetical protein|nr:hypothetical protein [Mediterranea sp.]
MKHPATLLLLVIGFVSCHYPRPGTGGGIHPVVRKNANLELYADSAALELLPLKDAYISLYKGAQVVVAEFAVHAGDSVDTVWVKVAHTQKAQGWLRESELTASFVPVNGISQFIHLFSHTYMSCFVVIVALFIAAYLFRISRRKQVRMVCFNDIDSIYPLLLCLLTAISAMLYESVQLFAPQTWREYFFNPTLSPFETPGILSTFLLSLWLTVLVMLAALDDIFSRLSSPSEIFFYVLGLLSACIFCYFFFTLTTRYYIGYLFAGVAVLLFIQKARKMNVYRYHCGGCGGKLKAKGTCPHCGAVNR